MSDLESLRKKIAEEEARLARVEKERTEAIAKLQELKGRLAVEDSAPTPPKPVPSDSLPFPSEIPSSTEEFLSGRLTLSESIRAASEIPFEVDLVEKSPQPRGAKNPRRK
jgi:hypothetical protein